MPSLPSHIVAALGIGACFYEPEIPKSVWLIGAACSVIPDLDVVGFRFGIHYGDFWGHRGFAHSLVFAALLALVIVGLGFRHGATGMRLPTLWLYFFLAATSHGLLDAMTDGGLGVAFFAPFDDTRYFFSFRPIKVSPIGLSFFSARGLDVLWSELFWVCIPAAIVAGTILLCRRLRRPHAADLPSASPMGRD